MFCSQCAAEVNYSSRFCSSCGATVAVNETTPIQLSTVTADQRLFVAKNESIFWLYAIGFVLTDQLGTSLAHPIVGLVNLVELVAFIVGFSKSSHTWLVLWLYALLGSALLSAFDSSTTYVPRIAIWLYFLPGGWFLIVGVLTFLFIRLSKRLKKSPWRISGSMSSW